MRTGDQRCGCPVCSKWDSENGPRSPNASSPMLCLAQLPLCYTKAQKVVQTENIKKYKSMNGYAMKQWTIGVKTVNRASKKKIKRKLCLIRPKLAINGVKNNLG